MIRATVVMIILGVARWNGTGRARPLPADPGAPESHLNRLNDPMRGATRSAAYLRSVILRWYPRRPARWTGAKQQQEQRIRFLHSVDSGVASAKRRSG